ncbi:hypothetical protein [Aeromonas sp. R9-2]|uniref:hypothetical protein n=1 Tax=Aeromonas sp. R9-2 TaxID=3138479 RepID=UPI0034A367E0
MMSVTLKFNFEHDIEIDVDVCEIRFDGKHFILQRDEINQGMLLLKTSIFDDDSAYQALSLNCVASNAINVDIKKDRVEQG